MATSRVPAYPPLRTAVAVYCGSSIGNQKAYCRAASSIGHALANRTRPLVYGGGSKGVMGVVSGAVLRAGGKVTGIVPYAMLAASARGEEVEGRMMVQLNEGPEEIETIVVDSMHERKVEMAKRVGGFVGLPGGFGTFEEILEVTTWTQLGIHNKPVVLINVLSFWEPLRELIKNGIAQGFIKPENQRLIVFVDGPPNHEEHEEYDWGTAALEALDEWEPDRVDPLFDWSHRLDGRINPAGNWMST